MPDELDGQGTAEQPPEKKEGLVDVAAIAPLKPASQAQSPAGTLVPVESDGQLDAMGTVVTKEVPTFMVGLKSAL